MKPDASPEFRSTTPHRLQSCRCTILLGLCAMGIAITPELSVAQEQALPVETQRLTPNTDTIFGNVRASNISSLSYGARGCIVDVSEDAKRERVAQAGQVLVKLDDLRSLLALRTVEARLSELAAAIEERQLSTDAARADDRRRKQELDLITEEFERSSVLLGRGLINESTMDTIERRLMDANFAAERAKEAIASAEVAKKRAEIALEIGDLDKESAEINHAMLLLTAPFDGVLVGFNANVGDCVQEGELAARIYVPDQKSIDIYFRISRLTATHASGLSIGATVKITRVNGQVCNGAITRFDIEATLESQFVEATVDVEVSCAPSLYLNEAVEVELVQSVIDNEYLVPNSAIFGENTVFLVDEQTLRLVAVEAEVVMRGEQDTIVRIPNANGRLLVKYSRAALVDGLAVEMREPG